LKESKVIYTSSIDAWNGFCPIYKVVLLSHRQETALQFNSLRLDLKKHYHPLTIYVYNLMPEYIDNTFQQIALFFTLGTGYLDNLNSKKFCTLVQKKSII